MKFNFEILESEDKNLLVLSSDLEIFQERFVLNDDSKAEQFPLIKNLFFLPFIKSITLDKHLILIEKLDFLDWVDVQDEVKEQIENFLNAPIDSINIGGVYYKEENSTFQEYIPLWKVYYIYNDFNRVFNNLVIQSSTQSLTPGGTWGPFNGTMDRFKIKNLKISTKKLTHGSFMECLLKSTDMM